MAGTFSLKICSKGISVICFSESVLDHSKFQKNSNRILSVDIFFLSFP